MREAGANLREIADALGVSYTTVQTRLSGKGGEKPKAERTDPHDPGPINVARGPVCGNPPSLEWLAVSQLQIDSEYQRACDGSKSRALIARMIRRWEWALCQPLVVTRRLDGSLFVIDGQHRWNGAKARGDIPHLPCVVIPAIERAEEAKTFVNLNTARQRLSQVEIFNGMLAASDADALAIVKLLKETGWALARHTNSVVFKPGELACVPMLVRQVRAIGEAPVRNALTALREAYRDTPVTVPSRLLGALMLIFQNERMRRGFDADDLIEALAECEDPQGWLEEGRGMNRANPALSSREALAEAMCEAARYVARERQAA